MNQQYTLVLPIKIGAHSHNELKRFTQIQLPTLNKFLDVSSVSEFIIICKEREMDIIQQALSTHPSPLPIKLIPENLLIEKRIADNMEGWYLQQLIKLAVSKIIKTPLYLILDTDCFLTKPFSYKNLFHQDKILIDKAPWTNHPDWWLGSMEIITEVPLTQLAADLAISVTPQILVTSIVVELIDYLNQKQRTLDWAEYLSKKFFTEFTLYWLFLLKTNRTDIYQLSSNTPLLLGNALWSIPDKWYWVRPLTPIRRLKALINKKSKAKKLNVKIKLLRKTLEQNIHTSFNNNEHFYFSLVQSNIKEISVDWIIEEINKHLN